MNPYSTPLGRVIMRFAEIFIISGLVGIFGSKEFSAMIPAAFIGLVAGMIKALREIYPSQA